MNSANTQSQKKTYSRKNESNKQQNSLTDTNEPKIMRTSLLKLIQKPSKYMDFLMTASDYAHLIKSCQVPSNNNQEDVGKLELFKTIVKEPFKLFLQKLMTNSASQEIADEIITFFRNVSRILGKPIIKAALKEEIEIILSIIHQYKNPSYMKNPLEQIMAAQPLGSKNDRNNNKQNEGKQFYKKELTQDRHTNEVMRNRSKKNGLPSLPKIDYIRCTIFENLAYKLSTYKYIDYIPTYLSMCLQIANAAYDYRNCELINTKEIDRYHEVFKWSCFIINNPTFKYSKKQIQQVIGLFTLLAGKNLIEAMKKHFVQRLDEFISIFWKDHSEFEQIQTYLMKDLYQEPIKIQFAQTNENQNPQTQKALSDVSDLLPLTVDAALFMASVSDLHYYNQQNQYKENSTFRAKEKDALLEVLDFIYEYSGQNQTKLCQLLYSLQLVSQDEIQRVCEITIKEQKQEEKFFRDLPMLSKQNEEFKVPQINLRNLTDEQIINLEKFSKSIYNKNITTQEQLQKRDETISRLKNMISKVNSLNLKKSEIQLSIFGSAANGFWNNSSDIDVVLIIERLTDQSPAKLLEKLKPFLPSIAQKNNILFIPHANIPIITYKDAVTGYEVDLSCHNPLGTANSCLLYTYAQFDQRAHIVGMVIRYLSKQLNVIGTRDNLFSSYALLNLVIAYLQHKKIVPNIQAHQVENWKVPFSIPVKGGKRHIMYSQIAFEQDQAVLAERLGDQHDDTSTVGELLVGFFNFYLYEFDGHTKQINIFAGEFTNKHTGRDALNPFAIVDPFDPVCNPGYSVMFNTSTHDQIRHWFGECLMLLKDIADS